MTVLMPRLSPFGVDACLADLEQFIAAAGQNLRPDQLPSGVSYAASGGTPVAPAALGELRDALLEIGRQCGFPERGGTRERARFDSLAAAFLHESPLLRGGEGLRDDVWAFLSTILMPDLTSWRFGAQAGERFHGGIRNTFQRLWIRARILDRGFGHTARWELLERLTEDALVQITERPSVAADPRLARAFAESWVKASTLVGQSNMEERTRAAIIRLRLRGQIQILASLPDAALADFMDSLLAPVEAARPQQGGWVRRMLGSARG